MRLMGGNYSVCYQSIYSFLKERWMLIKFTMQSKKKDSKAQEETPVEDTVTVSLEEYQMLREAAKNQ